MKHKKTVLFRIQLIFFGVFLFAMILVFRLYQIQVVHSESLREQGEKQYYREQSAWSRGTIFFQNKDGSLLPVAMQKTGFSLSVNPSIISDYNFHYEKLSTVLSLDKEVFDSKMEKGGVYQEIENRIDVLKAEAIKDLNLKGVNITKEKWRFYPTGTMAANILGIVAYNEDELAGRYGLERYYEDVLKRKAGASFVNFFAEVFTNIKSSVSSKDSPVKEGNIVATIEPQVQIYLEQKLGEINEKWDSEYSGGIIINPKTGEILGMSVSPSFDPNNFQNDDLSVLKNPLVESLYEMGSTVKPLTIAAGLDLGVITSQTEYFDAGTLTLNNWKISNFDGKGRGTVNMQAVLNNSLNTGVAFVASQMGKEKFAQYMYDFGLGEESGIDLPNEATNMVANLKSPREIEYATASFGQGISLTSVSMVRALSALANGGILITPHLVNRIDYSSGLSKKSSYSEGKRILKEETSEEISRMLVNTFDEALLGGAVKMENYSIAAKTGTAQIAKEGERGYYEDKFFHNFFGYFPAFEPKFLVFIFTYNPRGAQYASESLTHPFMDITKYLINYYSIPPDR